jgi:hypothetical protein
MVQYGKKWYRAKVLKDAGSKVMLEYQGFSHEGGPFWLARDHARIWRGSYKGKDWRYLVRNCSRHSTTAVAAAVKCVMRGGRNLEGCFDLLVHAWFCMLDFHA